MKGLIVIDMLNDSRLVPSGSLARGIVPQVKQLVGYARETRKCEVVYANDSRLSVDFDVRIFGEHAMRDARDPRRPRSHPRTWRPRIPTRYYSPFYGTDLEGLLTKHAVDPVAVTGLHTSVCCRYTSAT